MTTLPHKLPSRAKVINAVRLRRSVEDIALGHCSRREQFRKTVAELRCTGVIQKLKAEKPRGAA